MNSFFFTCSRASPNYPNLCFQLGKTFFLIGFIFFPRQALFRTSLLKYRQYQDARGHCRAETRRAGGKAMLLFCLPDSVRPVFLRLCLVPSAHDGLGTVWAYAHDGDAHSRLFLYVGDVVFQLLGELFF